MKTSDKVSETGLKTMDLLLSVSSISKKSNCNRQADEQYRGQFHIREERKAVRYLNHGCGEHMVSVRCFEPAMLLPAGTDSESRYPNS